MERLISFCGLFAMVVLAWLMSRHKRRIHLRVIVGGLLLQFGLAVVVLKTDAGQAVFRWISDVFNLLLGYVDAGSRFVFDMNYDYGTRFADERPPARQLLASFAFGVLPTIIFFSSLMSVLYYVGLMQWVVRLFAVVMQKLLGTSGAESLSAASNVFVGQTEAPLVVRPYVPRMTESELMAVMVGGFATIAGGVLAAYVSMGIDAGHLITASVISAPAALLIAKVMQPETGQPETLGNVKVDMKHPAANLIEAAAIGATDGMKLALNVAAMLIAFLALIALCNGILGWIGGWFDQRWSLEAALGLAFWPLAWLMGIEPADCRLVGELLGIKMVANEFVAYQRFSEWIQPDSAVHLSQRSQVIVTYALCGFSNFGSIGIQIAGIGAMAPDRRSDLARLGLRAMLGGTLACLMTACIAGVLI